MLQDFDRSTTGTQDSALQAHVADGPAPAPTETLRLARQQLESALDGNEDWRALQQLHAREDAGEWFDVVESDVLRDRLTRALAPLPAFMAWQFVDAALACLEVALATGTSMQRETEVAGGTREPQPSAATVAVAPSADGIGQPFDPELAARIPTLQVNGEDGVTMRLQRLGGDGQTPDAADRIMMRAADATAEPEATLFVARRPRGVRGDRRFDGEIAGIEEADVKIIVRKPAEDLLETRLPPLPLVEQASEPGQRLARTSRATTLKWVDPADDGQEQDFRLVGSALDEAQVSIIRRGPMPNEQSRAARRALGVAPDREQLMRRFLKALAGE